MPDSSENSSVEMGTTGRLVSEGKEVQLAMQPYKTVSRPECSNWLMKPQSCEGADGLTADSSDEELIRVTALVTDHLCEGTRNELVASLESGMEAQETIKTDLDARLSQQEAKQSEME
ncbi:hypothetical protein Pmar_PMAR013979, partial [Perkinsus marinus ATCC 50983]